MLSDLSTCSQCGASGPVGSSCEYCGATITAQVLLQDENHSVFQSWSDFRLDGFTLVSDNVKGNTDILDYCVIRGDRTGNQGLINRYGVFVIPCIYDHVTAYIELGVCCVCKNGQSGMMNLQGDMIIPMQGASSLDMLIVQNNLVVGFNSIYDLSGNLLIEIDSSERILLLTNQCATTYPSHRGMYDIESGVQILPSDFKVETTLFNGLFKVSQVRNGFTRYGIFNPVTTKFLLSPDYTTLQRLPNGNYSAKMQISENGGITIEKTIIFSFNGTDIVIERETTQTFQTGSNSGCAGIIAFTFLFAGSVYILL